MAENEKEKWMEVFPTMMSDEEEVEGKFKVCRQEWRSQEFNDFMEALDIRATESNPKRPRYDRYLGTPLKVGAPTEARDWMMASSTSNTVLAPDTPELV